jgi:hypothetical protein
MSDESERIKERLRKLLELARRGEGGEKETAEKFLRKLLAKHGLTVEDLGDEVAPVAAAFYYLNEMERLLIVQVVCVAKQKTSSKFGYHKRRHKTKGWKMTAALTPGQKIEAELMLQYLMPALRKEAERLMVAFASANKLHVKTDEPREPSKLSLDDMAAIAAMAGAIKPTAIPRGMLEHRA